MKTKRRDAFTGLVIFAFILIACANVKAQHHFSFKEYEEFHDVLHPLEHEALPNKDYARIRSQANELVRRGNAIVKRGVPQNSPVRAEMKRELKKFRRALSKFAAAARSTDNARLSTTYSAVHDSFEQLAALSRG